MSLTKKHFIEFAEILNQNLHREGFGDKEDTTTFLIIDDLCGYFKGENPKFDEVKFKEACLK